MNQLDSRLPPDPLPRGLAGVRELVSSRFAAPLSLTDLAVAARMPANTLTRRFHETYGMSPMRWLWTFRTLLAAELIALDPDRALTEVALQCGFGSSAHFSRRFRAVVNDTPSRYRASAREVVREVDAPDGELDPVITRVMARLEVLP